MKRVTIVLFALMACSEPEIYLYEYVVRNAAGFDVKMSCQDCEDIVLSNGSTRKIKGDYFITDYTITPTAQTSKVIDIDVLGTGGADYNIISYNYKVEYKVTGTVELVDGIIEYSDGTSSLFWDETIPYSIKFKTFDSDFVYLSAQNQNDDGACVKVEIYWRDKLFKSEQKCGDYVIATASGGIY